MTREEAIKAVGLELVEQAEHRDCDYTCHITDGSEWRGFTEFSACSDYNENMDRVVVYYYQPNEVLEEMRADGNTDLGGLDWEIDHYDVL
jgi:hypothetical protein